ncbi:hypothetical protein [Aquibacillus kalidii]|uniref:hypothetical protein n=1 Tax=Aquibacillus kalidii TaxID=2762597 RepID=UPI001645811B|nr:hypothetical protein [Aquibacillus kalidii]
MNYHVYSTAHHYHKPTYAICNRKAYSTRNPSPYPEVDTSRLQQSAKAFKPLMEDADKLIHAFSNSDSFAVNIMNAAQQSQTEKVKEYIKDVGITRPVDVTYNPDGIRLLLINQVDNIECCKLTLALQW